MQVVSIESVFILCHTIDRLHLQGRGVDFNLVLHPEERDCMMMLSEDTILQLILEIEVRLDALRVSFTDDTTLERVLLFLIAWVVMIVNELILSTRLTHKFYLIGGLIKLLLIYTTL